MPSSKGSKHFFCPTDVVIFVGKVLRRAADDREGSWADQPQKTVHNLFLLIHNAVSFVSENSMLLV